jgi:flagellar biosynthetic protein FliP
MKHTSFSLVVFRTFSLVLGLGIVMGSFPCLAETFSLDLGQGAISARLLQIIAMITVLSLAPSLLMMLTAFTRIVVVLSFLRHALGLQQSPPNSVIIGLSLFLTVFVMEPTFQTAYKEGLSPYLEERITEEEAIEKTALPFHTFMREHTRLKDLEVFMNLGLSKKPETAEATPYRVLIPAFMVSELRRAFEIGFLIFIPFLIIDLVVASILMSMGMMMLPPVMLSLPFKVIFFVLIDGWSLLAGSLVRSYS